MEGRRERGAGRDVRVLGQQRPDEGQHGHQHQQDDGHQVEPGAGGTGRPPDPGGPDRA